MTFSLLLLLLQYYYYPHRSHGPGKAYDARGGGGAEPSAERPHRALGWYVDGGPERP